MAQYKAAWYPDPSAPQGSGILRYYDGTAWTSHVHRPGAPLRAAARPQPAIPHTGAPTGRAPAARSASSSTSSATGRSGASWDSIPQPGTTFTSEGLQRSSSRTSAWLIVLLVVAVVAGLVLLLTP